MSKGKIKKGTAAQDKAPARPTPETPEQAKSSPQASDQAGPVIVGIGASAGGLESILTLFDHMPPDIGAGFVIVSHLDPLHHSMLPELVQKHTKMKVERVENELLVEPNRVYVIPPNTTMGIWDRKLQLLQREQDIASRKPIDYFLQTLAQDQGDRAVCIILSGMDSDGTQGLLAIKTQFGLAIVQDPNTARFAVMPQSAIDTGQADFVLPPEMMPRELAEFIRRSPALKHLRVTEDGQISSALAQVFMTLRAKTGHDFSAYKKNTILRRIERRLLAVRVETLEQYIRYLHDNPQEAELLMHDLLIGVTGFFRDPEAFDSLRTVALPRLLGDKPDGYQIRVWVVGCSTGEEAYSIAISLKEYMAVNKRDFSIQIFATDIDERALTAARAGLYPETALRTVNPQLVSRYFVNDNTAFRVRREIREMIVFASHSVIKDPPFTRLDLISCRNLLIYLGTEAQNKILPLLNLSLNPGGLLFLGNSESVGQFSNLFSPVDKEWKLFSKIGVPPPPTRRWLSLLRTAVCDRMKGPPARARRSTWSGRSKKAFSGTFIRTVS